MQFYGHRERVRLKSIIQKKADDDFIGFSIYESFFAFFSFTAYLTYIMRRVKL